MPHKGKTPGRTEIDTETETECLTPTKLDSRMQKRRVITSWPISFFWVFLSVATGILATYSFLQADWVIKRNLVITNFYQPKNSTASSYTNTNTNSNNSTPSAPVLHQSLSDQADGGPGSESSFTSHRHPYRTSNSHSHSHSNNNYYNYNYYSHSKNSEDVDSSSVQKFAPKSNVSLNHSHLFDILYENYGQYNTNNNNKYNSYNSYNLHGGDFYNSGESKAGLHARRVIKVTKVVTTIRFGTIGVCSNANANVNVNTNANFNVNTIANANTDTGSNPVQCRLYTVHDPFPVSYIWAMVTIIGGSGCMTLCVCAVLSLLAVALPSSHLRHQVATTIGYAQTVAVVLLFMSLLLFPLGFDSDFVHYHCGASAGPYNTADCEIGWAYALVLVCASLALYCPVLVKFTADVRYDALPKYL